VKYVEHIERESGVAMTAEGGVLRTIQQIRSGRDTLHVQSQFNIIL